MEPLADYLDAAYPEPVTLLGQRLQPFALGHMELLCRFGNAYVTPGRAPTLDDLAFAVFICSQTWREALDAITADDLPAKLKAWGDNLGPFVFEDKSEDFVRYLLAGSRTPEVFDSEHGGESTGLSMLHDVRLVLTGWIGYTREDAMNCPWGLARWDYYGWHAQRGNVRLVGEEMNEHLSYAMETNRKLAEARN